MESTMKTMPNSKKYALSILIHRYRAEWNAYVAKALEAETSEEENNVPRSYEPAMKLLGAWDQPAEDRGASIMALELALEDYEKGETPRIPAMIRAALGYLNAPAHSFPAPRANTGIMSIGDICRLIRALDTIEEVTHALGYSMENSAIKERHASGFLLELHEYLSGQRSNLLDFLGETTGATPEEEVIRLSAVVQYEAWCREFRKETLRQLNASALATEATG
jgi:hypothetical protein